MTKFVQNIIVIAAMLCFVAGSNLYPFVWKGFYYQCYAAGIFLLSIYVKDELKTIPAKVFFWLALFNLMDELLFNPQGFHYLEYAAAIFIIIHEILKQKKNATQQ